MAVRSASEAPRCWGARIVRKALARRGVARARRRHRPPSWLSGGGLFEADR